MNTYDAAYALAKEIKESDEMKRLTEAAEKIKGDEEARKMVKEYIMAQMKSDYARIAGQKEDEEAYKHLQELAVSWKMTYSQRQALRRNTTALLPALTTSRRRG